MVESRFEVLGPVRGKRGPAEVVLSAGREQILLAMLLLHANELVQVERLVDAIWGERPPRDGRSQVHGCVSRLRKRLTAAGMPAELIVTEPAGYGVRLDPRLVDLCEFRRLVGEARTAAAAGRPEPARQRYRAALQLWHGPALAGVDSDLVRQAATALDEERVRAIEECLEVELALGAAGELVPELTELVAAHPYRENLHGALMRALEAAGRHADALAAYQRLRAGLREELGTEPGPELQRLHRAILHRQPGPARVPGAARTGPVPRELPAEPGSFVGRGPELARLRTVLAVAESRRRPAVVVVYGPGGAGKSALSIRAGHDLSAEYPDGQLYLDLFGSTPGMRRLPAGDALGRLLRSLGVHPAEIPSEPDAAAARFRGITAQRRLLLVLDNAADRDQVAALIPGAPGCGVLITSRQPLPTLDADLRLRLGPLPDAEALALLAGLTRERTVTAGAARRIVSYSGGLPLAVRVAAARLAARPDLSGQEYADRLADDSRRLDELQVDDLAVRACLRTGYDALRGSPAGELAARAFRALGLLHVPDLAPGVVAAMLAEPQVATAAAALDRLVDAQLVEPVAGGRYRLHDLVRLVAAERAAQEDSPAARDQALHRAVGYYTGALHRMEAALDKDMSRPFGEPVLPPGVPLPEFADAAQARRWAEAELASLTAVLDQALRAPASWWRLSLWLSTGLWHRLDVRCDWQAAHRTTQAVLAAAQQRGDPELIAGGLHLHGRSEACLGRYESALAYLERALHALKDLTNHLGTALTLNGLGIVETRMGRHAAALARYQEALQLLREQGLQAQGRLATVVISNMSVTYTLLGELDQALQVGAESIALAAANQLSHPVSVTTNLAVAQCLRGDLDAAVQGADRVTGLAGERGDWHSMCEALFVRSEAHRRAGRLNQALADADETLSIANVWSHRFLIAVAHRQRERILAAQGDAAGAALAADQADQAYAEVTGFFREPLIEHLLAQPAPARITATAQK